MTTTDDVRDQFIQAWGEIASLWGVPRSVGRVQALLYLEGRPLAIDEMRERLGISHGNASTSLRDLVAWGVVRRLHPPGERKVAYEAEQDPWTWFVQCIRERRRREVVPVMEALDAVAADAHEAPADVRERIERFAAFSHEFVDLIDAFLAVGEGKMRTLLLQAAKLVPKGPRGKAP